MNDIEITIQLPVEIDKEDGKDRLIAVIGGKRLAGQASKPMAWQIKQMTNTIDKLVNG